MSLKQGVMESSQAAIAHPPAQGHPAEVTAQSVVALGHLSAGWLGQGRMGTAQRGGRSWGGLEGGSTFNMDVNTINSVYLYIYRYTLVLLL